MQALAQNKQKIYYALFSGTEAYTDADGLYTGEKNVVYGEPKSVFINVSWAKGAVDVSRGMAHLEEYGIDSDYAAVMVTDDVKCPIDETAVLWIGISPKDAQGNDVPYNYTVLRRLPSLNSVTYVCREVDVK